MRKYTIGERDGLQTVVERDDVDGYTATLVALPPDAPHPNAEYLRLILEQCYHAGYRDAMRDVRKMLEVADERARGNANKG